VFSFFSLSGNNVNPRWQACDSSVSGGFPESMNLLQIVSIEASFSRLMFSHFTL
jgi:hypothetical protein